MWVAIRVSESRAFSIGMLRMKGGTLPGTSSSPRNMTCLPVGFRPARCKTADRRGPEKRAVPTAPLPHWMPGTWGRCRLRPLPAHSSVLTTEWVSNFASSAKLRVRGLSTSPPMERRQSLASSSLGSCMWLRTKKCGTGVSQVLKYSTGLSRSTKRKERRTMPSSPGNSTDWSVGSAQVNIEGAAPAASAAAEICLRKLRLEFIGPSGAKALNADALRGAEAPLFHGTAYMVRQRTHWNGNAFERRCGVCEPFRRPWRRIRSLTRLKDSLVRKFVVE